MKNKLFLIGSLVLGAVLLIPMVAHSQDAATPADFAPKWKVGDWWVVDTFVPDLRKEITGMPQPVKPQLPGYPPLRGGVPQGFKRGARFRLEVVKNDARLSERDDELPPKKEGKEGKEGADEGGEEEGEAYYLVTVTSVGLTPTRSARLLYAVSDLALGEIQYKLGGKKTTTVKCFGTSVLNNAAATTFGFPFDWPDLVAARKPEASLKVRDQKIVQKCAFDKKSEHTVITLSEDSKKTKARYRVTQHWVAGEPWWSEHDGSQIKARLVERKKGS